MARGPNQKPPTQSACVDGIFVQIQATGVFNAPAASKQPPAAGPRVWVHLGEVFPFGEAQIHWLRVVVVAEQDDVADEL